MKEKELPGNDKVVGQILKETEARLGKILNRNVVLYMRIEGFTPADLNFNPFIDKVCHHYKVEREMIFSTSRERYLVNIRTGIFRVLRKEYLLSLKSLGRMFSLHHSTIIHGLRKKHNKYSEAVEAKILDIFTKMREKGDIV